ncbi:universal stress protein [Spongiivirga sp. MCCC 1A20706]|uniref:universal stress protein n=1 Tax=Spongiivirga sp. MCCC 1A20706 TaxID=3160963 RepID=UPI003977E0DA
MSILTKILVPFDSSPTSENALLYAIDFMQINKGSVLQLAHIKSAPEEEYDPKIHFERIMASIKNPPKIEVVFLTAEGALIDNLIKFQQEYDSDLIIMGTKGVERGAEDNLETNTSRLVLEADCAVIVVPQDYESFNIKKIALTIGDNPINEPKVLNVLLDISRTFDAKVFALTVDDPTSPHVAVNEKNEGTLDYYLESFYAVHSYPENEDMLEGIFDYVNKNEIDLLAILPRNHVESANASEGRLTKSLTLHSKVPVLAID